MQIDVTEIKPKTFVMLISHGCRRLFTLKYVFNCKPEQLSFENHVRVTNHQVLLCF